MISVWVGLLIAIAGTFIGYVCGKHDGKVIMREALEAYYEIREEETK